MFCAKSGFDPGRAARSSFVAELMSTTLALPAEVFCFSAFDIWCVTWGEVLCEGISCVCCAKANAATAKTTHIPMRNCAASLSNFMISPHSLLRSAGTLLCVHRRISWNHLRRSGRLLRRALRPHDENWRCLLLIRLHCVSAYKLPVSLGATLARQV